MSRIHFCRPQIMLDSQKLFYIGAVVPKRIINPYINLLKFIVGEKNTADLQHARILRDGPLHHITFISPPECEKISIASIDPQSFKDKYPFSLAGLGRVKKNESTSYFVVIDSDKIQSMRTRLGLHHRDLHITIGFENSDVYDEPKDFSTIISHHK